MLKLQWPSCSSWFSSLGPRAFTRLGKSATARSSNTATAPSGLSAWKRPSRCLQLAFLALGISAYLSQQTESLEDPQVSRLLARGWGWSDSTPCEALQNGRFYEVESESGATEFYFVSPEKILAPPPQQWPEPPALCREIPQPSFIQEVL